MGLLLRCYSSGAGVGYGVLGMEIAEAQRDRCALLSPEVSLASVSWSRRAFHSPGTRSCRRIAPDTTAGSSR